MRRNRLQEYLRGAPSGPKALFSIAAGIILPAFCLCMDPLVFAWSPEGQSAWGGRGEIYTTAGRRFFAYSFMALQMIVLFLGLLVAFRLGPLVSLVGGILLTGAVGALFVGVLLLPLSLIAVLFLVLFGALGFSPWIAALPYLREGLGTAKEGKLRLRRPFHVGSMALGAVLALGIPAWVDVHATSTIRRSIDALCDGNEDARKEAMDRLRPLAVFGGLPELALRAQDEEDHDALYQRLSRALQELTGRPVESFAD